MRLSGPHLFLLILASSFILVAPFAEGQRGTITAKRNLSDLTTMAQRIVQGRVMSARVEPDPVHHHLKTIVVTIQTDDVLKGAGAAEITFRQFIWDIRDVDDAAGYRAGDEVLLFLNAPTSLGFTSPVGLEQGRFRIVHDRNGEAFAINGNNNSELMEGVMQSKALNSAKLSARSRTRLQRFTRGPIPLSALKESVRLMVGMKARAQ